MELTRPESYHWGPKPGMSECSLGHLALLALGKEGTVEWSAGDVLAILGHPPHGLQGRPIGEVLSPEVAEKLEQLQSGQGAHLSDHLQIRGDIYQVDLVAVPSTHVRTANYFLVLRACREALQDFISHIPNAVLILAPIGGGELAPVDYRILCANEKAGEVFGVPWQQLTQRSLKEALPEFETAWLEKLREVLTTGETLQWTSQSPNLGGRCFSVYVMPGAHQTVIFGLTDITRQIKQEEELRQAKHRLDHVLKSAPLVLHVLRYDARRDDFVPVWVSPSVEELLGYTVDEAMRPEWWREIIAPEDRERVLQHSREVLARGQFQIEYRVRSKWGRELWILDFARVSEETNERPTEILVTWTDVSRRIFEEQLLKQQTQTLETLRDLSVELAQELEPDELAEKTCRKCVEVVGATVAWVGLKQPDGSVRPLARWPRENTFVDEVQVRWDNSPLSKGPTGRAIVTGEIQCYHDFYIDPSIAPWLPQLKRHGLRCGMAVPLVAQGQVLGSLSVYSEGSGVFTGWRHQLVQDVGRFLGAEMGARLAYRAAQQRLAQLDALRRIDLQIIHQPRFEAVADQVLEEALKALHVDAACFILWSGDGPAQALGHRGFTRFPFLKFMPPPGGVRHQIVSSVRRMVFEPLAEKTHEMALTDFALSQGLIWYCGEPVVGRDGCVGILEVYARTRLYPGTQWFLLLETLSGQAAIGFELAQHIADLAMHKAKLEASYCATRDVLVRALELREKETEGHTQRVLAYSLAMARAAGLSGDALLHVEQGALLHDIGKIGVPDSILLKPGPLTEEEWAVMRKHPEFARDLLWPIEFLRPAIDIPYCHHEKWDGTGYPQGLKGEEIPLAARLFAIVDVWDALLSDRPYRRAWTREQALEYIRAQSGHHFDPQAVSLFMDTIIRKYDAISYF